MNDTTKISTIDSNEIIIHNDNITFVSSEVGVGGQIHINVIFYKQPLMYSIKKSGNAEGISWFSWTQINKDTWFNSTIEPCDFHKLKKWGILDIFEMTVNKKIDSVKEKNSSVIDKIMTKFTPDQIPELNKWIDEWALNGSIFSLTEIEKFVNKKFWEWKIDTIDIIEWIISVWWSFTNRNDSDTWDMCYVEEEKLIEVLSKI